MRSYDEYCGVAKSLDVIGDRWALLIVRELTLRGACRYTDLRNGLPGIASNLLALRLRELSAAGVVSSEEAPPPVATTLFSLTSRGEELRPVLEALVRWGLPLMTEQKPDDAVRGHWLAWATELMLTDNQPDAPPITIQLHADGESILVEARDGTIHATPGTTDDPDVSLSGRARPILGLLLGRLRTGEGEAAGVTIAGNRAVLERVRAA
jgi:DNA-binding HxlR family transcriptional regulator